MQPYYQDADVTLYQGDTRECPVLRPERALRVADVLGWLGRAIKAHGAPMFLRRDNQQVLDA